MPAVAALQTQPRKERRSDKWSGKAQVQEAPLDDPVAEKLRRQRWVPAAGWRRVRVAWPIKTAQKHASAIARLIRLGPRSGGPQQQHASQPAAARAGDATPALPASCAAAAAAPASTALTRPPSCRLVEESDYQAAQELFGSGGGGSSSNPLDTMLPKSSKDMEEYATMLTNRCAGAGQACRPSGSQGRRAPAGRGHGAGPALRARLACEVARSLCCLGLPCSPCSCRAWRAPHGSALSPFFPRYVLPHVDAKSFKVCTCARLYQRAAWPAACTQGLLWLTARRASSSSSFRLVGSARPERACMSAGRRRC
jgi:hypothetical protein